MNMPRVSPAVRVSFGLVLFSLSVLLIADLVGLVPKKEAMMLDARKRVCESLAVQLSVAASNSDQELLDQTLESFVSRNDDVIAASMSQANGGVVAEFGSFVEFDRSRSHDMKSTENIVLIPVYAGAEHWGTVNVEFKHLSGSIVEMLKDSILGLLLFVAVTSLVGYIVILKKTLHVLDPG